MRRFLYRNIRLLHFAHLQFLPPEESFCESGGYNIHIFWFKRSAPEGRCRLILRAVCNKVCNGAFFRFMPCGFCGAESWAAEYPRTWRGALRHSILEPHPSAPCEDNCSSCQWPRPQNGCLSQKPSAHSSSRSVISVCPSIFARRTALLST